MDRVRQLLLSQKLEKLENDLTKESSLTKKYPHIKRSTEIFLNRIERKQTLGQQSAHLRPCPY